MSVEVTTSGNRELIKKYHSIIFFHSESVEMLAHNQEAILAELLLTHLLDKVKEETQNIFNNLLLLKTGIHKNLKHERMSMGEKVCLGFSIAFAIRKVINLDLPAVFESPYHCLDITRKHSLREFLKGQSCQQIILGTDLELELEKNDAQYRLQLGC